MENQPENPEFRINPENFHPQVAEINKKMSWQFLKVLQ